MSDAETILEADGLRVVFFRRGDRYAHRVEVFEAMTNRWRAALESLEGEPGDQWPPSPPLQQLHVERRATGPVVLLVGMAGKNHWSGAVEIAADRRSIVFDVAARVQNQPLRLGSEYVAASSFSVGGTAVELTGPRLELKSQGSSDDRRINPFVPTAFPATIAWKYAFLA